MLGAKSGTPEGRPSNADLGKACLIQAQKIQERQKHAILRLCSPTDTLNVLNKSRLWPWDRAEAALVCAWQSTPKLG